MSNGVHHFRVIVQSDKYTPSYLTERVEAWILSIEVSFFFFEFCSFFSHSKDLLEKISEEDLSKNKESLIAKLLEKDKTLVAQINRFLSEFTFPRRHCFNRRMF